MKLLEKEKIRNFFQKNPKFIEMIALAIMTIVFLLAFYYIIKHNNPFIFILSFLLLAIILLVFHFFVKDRFARRFLLKCLIFPIIVILMMIFFLTYFNISDGKAENLNHYEIKFDLYILDNATSLAKFNEDLQIANKIWGGYNISLILESPYFINTNLNDEDKSFLLNNNATEEDCLKYNEIINSFSENFTKLKVVILSSDSKHKGRGCICGCNSVILEPKRELLFDLTGWNLAHEFGHIFGLIDLRNRWNLMCDEFKMIKPKFLNKKQINSVSQKIESFLAFKT